MEAEKVLEMWIKTRQIEHGKYDNNYTDKELCELMRMYYHMRIDEVPCITITKKNTNP